MSLTNPAQPEFDVDEWLRRPHSERVQATCETWAMQGFGAPGIAYGFYADAARGELAEAHLRVSDLLEMQPWGGRPDLVVADSSAQLEG